MTRKEAIKVVKNNLPDNSFTMLCEALETLIPELKENEDERIRKNCIHFLKLQKEHHAATFEIEECITWLEKQGKQTEKLIGTTDEWKGGEELKTKKK